MNRFGKKENLSNSSYNNRIKFACKRSIYTRLLIRVEEDRNVKKIENERRDEGKGRKRSTR